jgi:hypothetical protein
MFCRVKKRARLPPDISLNMPSSTTLTLSLDSSITLDHHLLTLQLSSSKASNTSRVN